MFFRVKKIARMLVDIFLAFPCPGCGSKPLYGHLNGLCEACLEQIRHVPTPYCTGCGGRNDGVLDLCTKCMKGLDRPWNSAIAVFEYDSLAGRLVHQLKYYGRVEVVRILAGAAAERVLVTGESFDCIVPVPLHWTRGVGRGFNQSKLLANELSRLTGIPVRDALYRRKIGQRQASLGKKERLRNLRDAFMLRSGTLTEEQNILLLDDVLTTGATLQAATEVLKAGKKNANVHIIVMARR